jgi:DNA polymerase-4
MAVCGSPENRHGIILAKNELAKAFGVATAETVWQAQKKCPELVLVPPHHDEYEEYSHRVNAIYARFTDMVEPFGIDESWLDVTGSRLLFGDGVTIADTLRRTVREETRLTVSVGVSFNKVFAKLGSDYKKPDATTLFDREAVERKIHPLPVESLLYVGQAAAKTLHSMYIRTIGELARADKAFVAGRLGKMGEMIHDYANGLDDSPVAPYGAARDVKSVGNGLTFPRDLVGYEEIHNGVVLLSDTVASRLRQSGRYATVVQVALKSPSLRQVQRQKGVRATDLSRDLVAAAMELVRDNWEETAPLRMLTVTAAGLTDRRESEQMSLFEETGDDYERQSRIATAMDGIRDRFGRESIRPASILHNDWEKK